MWKFSKKQIRNVLRIFIPICISLSFFQSCVDDTQLELNEYDNNKLNMVVADNFNLSLYNTVLSRSGLGRIVSAEDGPFTLFVPSNKAFEIAGYKDQVAVLTAPSPVIYRIANYHTLDGKYELNKLPFLFNQELESRSGKLFATRWVKGADTLLLINGSRIIAQNIQASNGLIQVIDRVLSPYVHDQVVDAVAGRKDLTLFNEIIRSSGLLPLLREHGPYTIFAPNNDAIIKYGLKTVQQIRETKPSDLESIVRYHVLKDRRFIYDFILSTGASNKTLQNMISTNRVEITLVPDVNAPGTFNSITLKGDGNTSQVKLKAQDELCGNGVLHVIDDVLRVYR